MPTTNLHYQTLKLYTMKKMFFPALIAITVLTSAFNLVTSPINWKVKDDNYTVKFTSKKVEGIFKGLKSDIHFDEANLAASKITASIDATTVSTGNGMRNKHARQGLGADQYSTIKFVSTSIAKTSKGYEATGKLTIRDVTKEIKLPFTFTQNPGGGVFKGGFSVVPADYNVKKSGTPDKLDLQIEVPVVK
jgi:polyisoprenoid-binding protein YceI